MGDYGFKAHVLYIYDGLYAYVSGVYMNVCVLILDACKCSVNILIVCVVLDSY